MKITPFLESANQVLGYGLVSASPDVEGYTTHARLGTDDLNPSIVCRVVHTPDGKLTFYSRERPAGAEYRDKAGRPIRRIDGICVSGDPEGTFVFNPRYLDEAETLNDKHFERFWTHTDSKTRVSQPDQEIKLDPTLTEELNGVVFREAYTAPKKNQRPAAEPEPAKSPSPEREPVLRTGNGGDRGTSRESIQGSEALAARRVAFRPVIAVALGGVGLGLIAHGVLSWFRPQRHPQDNDKRRPKTWQTSARAVAELGAGVGLTWVACVEAQRDAGHLIRR